MTTANSFILMMEEDELMFPPPPEIEEHVFGSLQVLSMMIQAVDLYIPKAAEMFILTLGGTIKEIDTLGKDELPEGDLHADTGEDSPGSAGNASDHEYFE